MPTGTNPAEEAPKLELIYLMDPLCGWCYGFGPVIRQIQDDYADRVTVTVLPGGMITGTNVKPIAAMAGYLRGAYPRVEQTTGVTFGEAWKQQILEEGSYEGNSEPPSRAILTYQDLGGENPLAFAEAVQTALYLHGMNLNEDSTYQHLAREHGVDPIRFMERYHSDDLARATQQTFAQVAQMGVSGFPTLLLNLNGELKVLAQGYAPVHEVRKKLGLKDKDLGSE